MSDHDIENGNNWTALTSPEEAVVETLRPLAGVGQPEGKSISTIAEADDSFDQGPISLVDRIPLEAKRVEDNKHPGPSQDPAHEPSLPAGTPPHAPSLHVPASFNTLEGTQSHSERPESGSFSESYAHIGASPEERPAPLLAPLTLGGTGYLQDEEELLDGAQRPLNGEGLVEEEILDGGQQHLNGAGLGQEEEGSPRLGDRPETRSEVGRCAGWEEVPEQIGAGEQETGMRTSSILATLEQIGQTEEDDEEVEEEFQIPQREPEEAGFSLNKCILGAVILVGLGTIFFSGVFMDLDKEGEFDTRDLGDVPMQGKREWPNPEVPVPPVDGNSPDQDNQHRATLHAQQQAPKEELKVAKGHSAEEAKERQRREEVEKEHGKLKQEPPSLAALQKENERMKRELESVAALQREVETLRATVTDLLGPPADAADPLPVPPPSVQAEIDSQDPATAVEKDMKKPWQGEKSKEQKKYDQGGKAKVGDEKEWKDEKDSKKDEKRQKKHKDWKEVGDEKEWKKDEKDLKKDKKRHKEWKKDEKRQKEWNKGLQEKEGKVWSQKDEDWKNEAEQRGQWKKERASTEGEGNHRGGQKEGRETGQRKDEGKEWKRDDHEKRMDDKEWKSKHEKKGGKKKDGYKESSKGREVKGDGKDWKRKDDYKQGHEEGKGKENEWSRDGEQRKKDVRKGEDWRKDLESKRHHHDKIKDGHKPDHNEQHQHSSRGVDQGQRAGPWHSPGDKKPPHSHRQPLLEQPDYWEAQRERLQHSPRPQTHCSSVEACAQAEGLRPVPLSGFEDVLQGYLTKAEEVGVEPSKREELSKLVTEFFKDGVFVHHQLSFLDFVEDVGDILEDMVENDGEEDDDALEDEMEEFEVEILKAFALEREELRKGNWKKESGRGRG